MSVHLWRLALLGLIQASPLHEQPTPERDYAIFNVVLDRLPEGASRADALIKSRTVTRDGSFRRSVLRLVPKLRFDSALVDSLASGSEAFTPHVLDSTALGSGVRLISDSAFRSFFRTDPTSEWIALRERYPGVSGVVELSNIAYHPNGALAVVYVAVRCGPLCGWGGLYYLERTGAKWTIMRVEGEWVS